MPPPPPTTRAVACDFTLPCVSANPPRFYGRRAAPSPVAALIAAPPSRATATASASVCISCAGPQICVSDARRSCSTGSRDLWLKLSNRSNGSNCSRNRSNGSSAASRTASNCSWNGSDARNSPSPSPCVSTARNGSNAGSNAGNGEDAGNSLRRGAFRGVAMSEVREEKAHVMHGKNGNGGISTRAMARGRDSGEERAPSRGLSTRAMAQDGAAGDGETVAVAGQSGRGYPSGEEAVAVEVAAVAGESRREYPPKTGVVVVGAGLAGLGAARWLAKEGIPFALLEASDGVGGRVRTDTFRGFVLDRGFQIHVTAYPEAREVLDYGPLDLRSFYAGAMVWFGGEFHRVADPFRHLRDGLLSLGNPIGTLADKLRVGVVRLRAAIKSDDDIRTSPETTVEERLRREGFSDAMVDRFFRPFFGGIFFDTTLQTTTRLYDFVLKCLALGSNTLPVAGIGSIPQQLASRLPSDSLFLNSKVLELVADGDGVVAGVRLADGQQILAEYGVVVAVEGPEAARLLEGRMPLTLSVSKPPRSTVCLYFSTDERPFTTEPVIFLNGSGKGVVNNMFFPSNVVPSYAPPGKTLVSASLIGGFDGTSDAELEKTVRGEMVEWFGASFVESWEILRIYRIPFAHPHQVPPTNLMKEPRVSEKLYVCGDHRDSSSFDAVLVSGRRAVQALLSARKV